MKFAAATLLIGSASAACPTLTVGWFKDENCTEAMDAAPTEGADFDAAGAVETAWNAALTTCTVTGETSASVVCNDVGYTAATYTDKNCSEGEEVPEGAVYTNFTTLAAAGCTAGTAADTYFSWTITGSKALYAGAAAALAMVASQF